VFVGEGEKREIKYWKTTLPFQW